MKVYAICADGLEETECLAVVDVLRRSNIECQLISISNKLEVISSHNIKFYCDALMKEVNLNDADFIFLPGGKVGSENLSNSKELIQALKNQLSLNKRIAAICAAPAVVLGRHKLLENKNATCYPGFEKELHQAIYSKEGVITDGLITTSRGLGFSFALGLEIVSLLISKDFAENIKKSIQYEC